MARRTPSGKFGAGDSSISFWWRRWAEQSRSPSQSVVPKASASTCISMWRGQREVALDVALVTSEVAERLALVRSRALLPLRRPR